MTVPEERPGASVPRHDPHRDEPVPWASDVVITPYTDGTILLEFVQPRPDAQGLVVARVAFPSDWLGPVADSLRAQYDRQVARASEGLLEGD